MLPIVCLTISTKYDDLLNVIIHQNYKFFEKWYIVTHEKDKKTIEVIKKANYPNIEILYFRFWKNGEKFNKGGAVRYAQNVIYEKYKKQDISVLITDSDIYLPDNFMDIYQKIDIERRTLYAPMHRFDFSKYSDFIENKNYTIYYADQQHFGFFQLYRKPINSQFQPLYKHSKSAAMCDSVFRKHFSKHLIMNDLIVSHLGAPKMNWNTRKTTDDFLLDIQI
jgi:hypothetical protein